MAVMINGQLIPDQTPCIPAFDRGLTLGHGLFETILVHQGQPVLLKYHWHRLETSAALLGIRLPLDLAELTRQMQELLAANHASRVKSGLRLTITDGVGERGLLSDGNQPANVILASFNIPEYTADSMSATIVSTRRNEKSLSSRIKSLSYLDNILAKKEAATSGFDEAVMLNSEGFVADGAISNLYIVKKNQVFTPGIDDGALPGVIRHLVVHELGLARERLLTVADLHHADAIFISNALMGIKVLHKLDQRELTLDSPVIKLIREKISSFQRQTQGG